ncbi:hypothetical protein GCM10011534_29320 [Pseudooceanicola nanhaiensis]|uniref:Uncharacterized protein n=1 Tax=Pseudooceanicola nanhaiensis TaxID=375761 RepID=A0A917WGV6_9RHOB|nr:hypothetical protein GCM10011534_29320 [Pseudooceanicola nanhaiensis]
MTSAFATPPRAVPDPDVPVPMGSPERPDCRGVDCAMDCLVPVPCPRDDREARARVRRDPGAGVTSAAARPGLSPA